MHLMGISKPHVSYGDIKAPRILWGYQSPIHIMGISKPHVSWGDIKPHASYGDIKAPCIIRGYQSPIHIMGISKPHASYWDIKAPCILQRYKAPYIPISFAIYLLLIAFAHTHWQEKHLKQHIEMLEYNEKQLAKKNLSNQKVCTYRVI